MYSSSTHSDFPHGKYGRDIREAMRDRVNPSQLHQGERTSSGPGGYQQEVGGGGYSSSSSSPTSTSYGGGTTGSRYGGGDSSMGTSGTGGPTGSYAGGYGSNIRQGSSVSSQEGARERNPGKIHGTFEKMTGSIQHGMGRMFGSPSMALKGEEKRAMGQMEIQAAEAHRQARSGHVPGTTTSTSSYHDPLARERQVVSEGDVARTASGYD